MLRRSTREWFLVCVLFLGAGCAGVIPSFDDQDAMAETPAASEPPPETTASVSVDDGADWIQLSSGEWLRGTLVRVRKGELTFDSDELDEQSFDLEDVQRVISVGRNVVLTEDGRMFEGVVSADDESFWITSAKTVRLPREEVLSVLGVDGDGVSTWTGKVSLGATFRRGNTEQADYSTVLRATRETARTRWASKYLGAVSNVNDQETANNHRLTSKYDVYLTKRAFLTAPGIDVYRDRFQNIALRVTPYVALGYELLDTGDHFLAVSLGPAFRYQRADSTQSGEDPVETTAAAVFSSQYSWDVSSHIDLEFSYDLVTPIPDTDEYNHNALLGLAIDLPGNLDLDISLAWDRLNKPELQGDDDRPEPDDFRTMIGLGWSF